MPSPRRSYISYLIVPIVFGLSQIGIPQISQINAEAAQPVAKFQSSTRLVTVEVVVKDHQGHHATGLTAADFQLFEQSPSRGKEKHEQKIAVFREIRQTGTAKHHSRTDDTAGVYTNTVMRNTDSVTPTILLLDGLNTEIKYQTQVHLQMMKMLRSLPQNVPVAVFLFGHRLTVLQDFTTDPRRLAAALDKGLTTAGEGLARLDPRDDPNSIAGRYEKINGLGADETPSSGAGVSQGGAGGAVTVPQWAIDTIKRFEQETYASSMDMRVQQTIETLISLGRHVAGYPGRKNLLWVSTSFPIYLAPLADDSGKAITEFTGVNNSGWRNYGPQLKMVANVLSESKVAVYPINPAGVVVPDMYDVDTRLRDESGRKLAESVRRESMVRGNEQDTMQVLANSTGGQVCTGNNDLGECVHRAMDDSSTFYEISYYPDSRNWNGEYRKITVKAKEVGLHLAYRQGYFARSENAPDIEDQTAELKQAACEDYLDATSLSFSAKNIAPDSPGQLKYLLSIDPSDLTLQTNNDGSREVNLAVAVCTFDKKGMPFLFMSDLVQRKFDAHEYELLGTQGLPHMISLPSPKPPSLRVLVKDIPSGRLGSINVPVEDDTAQIANPEPTIEDSNR